MCDRLKTQDESTQIKTNPTKKIEKLQLRRMLATYRNLNTGKTTNTKNENHKHKEHTKNQPILPEVGQFVVDPKSGKKYLRGRLMGKGGFARCYEVTDVQTDKKYACKAISKARIAKPHQQQKIANEVELHKSFNGHFIVRFYCFFEDDDNVYILLELCSRKSMVQLLKQRRTLTEPEVRYFMAQAVKGVYYLHNEQIIHRDIKLGNLFINNDMEIRIGDFGLAVKADKDGKKEMSVCGTPNYIAPEVLSKTGHSFEVDTWALGCVMYTLLVGRPPFETSCLKDTYMRIRNNEYAIPSRITRPAAKLIQKFLSERPEDRPRLDTVLNDEFFTRGFFPRHLPSICCVAPPKFTSMKNKNCTSNKRYVRHPGSEQVEIQEAMSKINIRDKVDDDQHESGFDSQESNVNCDEHYLEEELNETSYGYHTPQTLYERLNTCLNSMPDPHCTALSDPISTGTSDSEEENSLVEGFAHPHRLWITKWVDYSNKYGFGAQLSNGCIVIRYNDGTTLAVDAPKRRLQYFDEDRNIFRFSVNNIPEDLSRKVTLLNYFSNYMDKHLLKGGDLEDPTKQDTFPEMAIIDIWFRTDKAMVMYLSDGTLQVNFLSDHTKIILNPENNLDVVTYINQSRESHVTSLQAVSKRGCNEDVNERLQYCLMVLHKLTEMYLDDMK
ncbi:serine/threonine-protein kinase PLK1-like isoform X2 [Hydractinia symbiolongicarpus]|uniref:serine/threonine-protein kinase PLK1-like isoform X2 n=1 Tax=Hydractinia symbiolongicarpus TaxID=13093 RepID=UPI00255062FF|nr:serine/threonine-protein kinase PLK1-like isoform X2 [Hydractinia symbiolongicarpus]